LQAHHEIVIKPNRFARRASSSHNRMYVAELGKFRVIETSTWFTKRRTAES
jgi:hypothetical protein